MGNTFTEHNRASASKTKALLKTNFLNSLGQDKRFEQSPILFDALEALMFKYGELFVKGFNDELKAADAGASGFLEDTIRFEYTKKGQTYTSSFYMADYAKFVDEGVQGVDPAKSKNTTSPYKFKFANPSKKHIEALEKWIAAKNVTAIITVPKGIVSDILKPKSLAYAIGYSIKKRGIKATYFKKKTVEKLIDKFKAEVGQAIREDITVNVIF